MTLPDHAVIIPHFNDIERLLRRLSALMPQVTPEVEVVVVDSGSDQLALRIVTELGRAKRGVNRRAWVSFDPLTGVTALSSREVTFFFRFEITGSRIGRIQSWS